MGPVSQGHFKVTWSKVFNGFKWDLPHLHLLVDLYQHLAVCSSLAQENGIMVPADVELIVEPRSGLPVATSPARWPLARPLASTWGSAPPATVVRLQVTVE